MKHILVPCDGSGNALRAVAHAAAVDRILGPAEGLLKDAGLPYRIAWRVGEPAPEIVAELGDKAYDAIVMGTRGLGPIANLVLGSVANQVQCLAGVPVTLIK